jgi:uncharacterized cysteine cluster protein YcgN (CxxCxxCC family)
MNISNLPIDITNYIFTFVRQKVLKTNIINDLLSNISANNMKQLWDGLNENMNAIDLLTKYPNNINWNKVVNNINVEKLLIDKQIDNEQISTYMWKSISRNPGCIKFIEKNLDKVDWLWLSTNENAIHLLEEYPDKIKWGSLIFNKNAIHLLEQHVDKYLDSVDNMIYNNNILNSQIFKEIVEENINNFSVENIMRNKSSINSEKIMDIMYDILPYWQYLLLTDPKEAFESNELYTYLYKNYDSINWKNIFMYDEFFESEKMISLLEKLFSETDIDLIDDLFRELLANKHSILIDRIYKIIVDNKENIDYYSLGKNPELFTNIYN